ncbi:MAG: ribose-phosphate pyrophosphokinase [Candidatus Heimdallarchaeota archaeon]|nr:ribose-phosphate pyrophosphokinase [Candidatus Heimdallarchaeota archaeon]
MKILAGPASIELGKKIANELNLSLINLENKLFTDGETYLQIDGEVENEEVMIVQNTFPNQEKRLIEIMLIASTLKEFEASKVYLFAPYLCYARADRRRIAKEIISHKVTLELLYKSGVDSVLTFNVHNREAFTSLVPELEKYDISILPEIRDYLKDIVDENFVIVGPDRGITNELQYFSDELTIPFNSLDKFRDPETHEITMTDTGLDIEDKNVILLDDVITSGGTAIDACKLILSRKPKSLFFLVIHAIAKPDVFVKIKEIGVDKVISTNTITRSDIEQIEISSAASKFIKDKFL